MEALCGGSPKAARTQRETQLWSFGRGSDRVNLSRALSLQQLHQCLHSVRWKDCLSESNLYGEASNFMHELQHGKQTCPFCALTNMVQPRWVSSVLSSCQRARGYKDTLTGTVEAQAVKTAGEMQAPNALTFNQSEVYSKVCWEAILLKGRLTNGHRGAN